MRGLCFDTGHLYYSHMDPVEYLKKYADRLGYVHFKDVNEMIYREVLGERIRFFEGCGRGAMYPIGTGALNYPGIKKRSRTSATAAISQSNRSATRATPTPVCAT